MLNSAMSIAAMGLSFGALLPLYQADRVELAITYLFCFSPGIVSSMALLSRLLQRVGGLLACGRGGVLVGFQAVVALAAIGIGSCQLAGLH